MSAIIESIERILREHYAPGFGHLYVASARWDLDEQSLDDFRARLGHPLPDVFYAFYGWLRSVDFPFDDVEGLTSFSNFSFGYKPTLKEILTGTAGWEALQRGQPEREWQAGFVDLGSWDSAYQLALDTAGAVAAPGAVVSWDFKGGSEYQLYGSSYEQYLQLELALLENQLFFPPADDEPLDDFLYGSGADRRAELRRMVLGDVADERVPFP